MATKERIFTSDDICSIIRACSNSGVRTFSYMGLDVAFVPVEQDPIIDPVFIPEEIKVKASSQAREAVDKEEIKYKDEEIALMQIEDPYQYEQLLKAGDIVNEEI